MRVPSARELDSTPEPLRQGTSSISGPIHLKIDFLARAGSWAASVVPPLGALFGSRLAQACEEEKLPSPARFTCQRCETILNPGVNCTPVGTRKHYACSFCGYRSVKPPDKSKGTRKAPPVAHQEVSSRSRSRKRHRKRKGWLSLKDIATEEAARMSTPPPTLASSDAGNRRDTLELNFKLPSLRKAAHMATAPETVADNSVIEISDGDDAESGSPVMVLGTQPFEVERPSPEAQISNGEAADQAAEENPDGRVNDADAEKKTEVSNLAEAMQVEELGMTNKQQDLEDVTMEAVKGLEKTDKAAEMPKTVDASSVENGGPHTSTVKTLIQTVEVRVVTVDTQAKEDGVKNALDTMDAGKDSETEAPKFEVEVREAGKHNSETRGPEADAQAREVDVKVDAREPEVDGRQPEVVARETEVEVQNVQVEALHLEKKADIQMTAEAYDELEVTKKQEVEERSADGLEDDEPEITKVPHGEERSADAVEEIQMTAEAYNEPEITKQPQGEGRSADAVENIQTVEVHDKEQKLLSEGEAMDMQTTKHDEAHEKTMEIMEVEPLEAHVEPLEAHVEPFEAHVEEKLDEVVELEGKAVGGSSLQGSGKAVAGVRASLVSSFLHARRLQSARHDLHLRAVKREFKGLSKRRMEMLSRLAKSEKSRADDLSVKLQRSSQNFLRSKRIAMAASQTRIAFLQRQLSFLPALRRRITNLSGEMAQICKELRKVVHALDEAKRHSFAQAAPLREGRDSGEPSKRFSLEEQHAVAIRGNEIPEPRVEDKDVVQGGEGTSLEATPEGTLERPAGLGISKLSRIIKKKARYEGTLGWPLRGGVVFSKFGRRWKVTPEV